MPGLGREAVEFGRPEVSDRFRPRVTHATVVAYLALFVALGGTSYAATQLSRNSVRAEHIAKNAVTGPKIKNNAITSAKIKDGSLLAEDFKTGQLIAVGRGPKGEAGAQGQAGPQGPAGATSVVRRSADGPLVAHGGIGTVTASCAAGERATGGGWIFEQGTFRNTLVESSYPLIDAGGIPRQWYVRYWNNTDMDTGTSDLQLGAYVICASP
jgi:hypothetical protein